MANRTLGDGRGITSIHRSLSASRCVNKRNGEGFVVSLTAANDYRTFSSPRPSYSKAVQARIQALYSKNTCCCIATFYSAGSCEATTPSTRIGARRAEKTSTRTMNPSVACAATGQLPLLIIGLGPIGIEAALALAESARCCLSLVDDALADSRWRETASCLLHQYQNASAFASGGAAAPAGACKASTRSQYLASAFTYLSKQNVRAISPGGDASIIDNFKAVILTDPTLPHAIAFNEHVSDTR